MEVVWEGTGGAVTKFKEPTVSESIVRVTKPDDVLEVNVRLAFDAGPKSNMLADVRWASIHDRDDCWVVWERGASDPQDDQQAEAAARSRGCSAGRVPRRSPREPALRNGSGGRDARLAHLHRDSITTLGMPTIGTTA